MRLHPILHIWKLHDGTDFGAGCGTPIHAAASGTVTEEYYNGGYGNRLFIDHGNVGGVFMTTSYNHMSGYAVKVGWHVTQGQVIGYVGTTGYSTGCHLHFMLWVNGTMVNPANYL
jgi:murein DD-endopeptidase MepM/ murein hydrolase activator NlpD